MQQAIGDRLTCVFVDHGLLRKGEAEQVERDFVAATGVDLTSSTRAEEFLDALAGVTDPGGEAQDHRPRVHPGLRGRRGRRSHGGGRRGRQGRVPRAGHALPRRRRVRRRRRHLQHQVHHNVGGLPEDLEFELVEPLRTLFKDEVRLVGEQLGLPAEIVWRQPFPGPGLGIRIIGEVTRERLDILREADAIAREELTRAGLDRDIWQMPVVLLADVRSVGVQGDGRTYGHPVVLRPVTSEDAMTADWARLPYDVLERISTRITNEVREVNRVTVDITSKPPGTIEWECAQPVERGPVLHGQGQVVDARRSRSCGSSTRSGERSRNT